MAEFVPLHLQFAIEAARTPDLIAVRSADETLTYGALASLSRDLAGSLLVAGVRAETPVALLVERDFALPVGMLGILAAGGTYVPLDPEHPDERLAHMLAETRAHRIVASAALAKRVTAMLAARAGTAAASLGSMVMLLDRAGRIVSATGDASAPFAPVPAAPGQRAYIIYTSGSTGAPKGVEVEHGALCARHALSPYRRLMQRAQVLAAVTAVSWNPSVYELLCSFAQGVMVALAPLQVVRDPRRLARFLDEHDVDFMRAVPSLWQALVDSGWQGRRGLTIVCHGERLERTLEQRLGACGERVWNTYGSTEASVFSLVESSAEGHANIIVAGRGETSELRILDPELAPTEPLAVGEIHVAGPVLARGYLADPELTAARFVRDPRGGGRLYKTGDVARLLADGAIALLGRADQQVKIRGQRVELGEVEAALHRFPGVAEAVVLVTGAPGDERMLAYLGVGAHPRPSVHALRAHLAATLPDAMIPASFVVLDALPRNANGKLERGGLPPPRGARPALEQAPVAPETPDQATLARLFGEVLQLDEVGIDDDFFLLGGHSLAAARIMARVHDALALEVPLAEFFDSPTVRALADVIARRRADGASTRAARIPRSERRTPARLSFAQERLWFLDRLVAGGFAFNLPMAVHLRGALAVGALRRAFAIVLDRHEALRTSLNAGADGVPRQVVHDVTLDVPLVDLTSLPADQRAGAAREQMAVGARQAFDLGRPPLIRAAIYRLAHDAHLVFIVMHHVASDGWSKAVFRRELASAYAALARGAEPELPTLPIQYRDYAAWQRQTLDEVEIARQLAYWSARLAGLEPLDLPTDKARPPVFTHRGARRERVIAEPLTAAIGTLAQRHGASLFMALLAVFDGVMARYSGQTDIAVGSPIAGRNAVETEGLIGFFVNTLVLRAQVDPEASFLSLLDAVRRSALDAYAHQDLPFERLVSELNPERDMSRHPLVQTVFALQNTPWEDYRFAGLEASSFAFDEPMTRLDLELHVWLREGRLVCHLIYCTDLFEAWRIEQLLAHFEGLMGAVVAHPDAPLARLDMLAPAERRRLLLGWNQTARAFPEGRALHELFEDAAATHPDRIAVVDGAVQLSYRELDARANRVARHLMTLGVGPEVRVGIGLGRSWQLLVANLATLKAGGAFVPLDPDYPAARLQHMLEVAEVAVLITRADLVARFEYATARILDIDSIWQFASAEPSSPPARPSDPGALAYVMFTSGSTGRPSGVAIEQRGLVNVVTWHREAASVTEHDRASWLASPSFDASVLETWPYLISGASLHVVDDDTRLVPSRLLACMAHARITIGFVPTPLLELCLDAPWPDLPSLRALVTGGDRLCKRPPASASFTLFNHYGPAECSVATTCGTVLAHETGAPTIGRPIANVQVYLLDHARTPVPIGVPGELYIGGVGVARGYVGEPVLTAERFIANPFGPGRLYRSGDRARYRSDGELEFLGRVDHQVKIRGARVEPGEIDATLAECAGVAESLTLAREHGPGDIRLVSYIVASRSARTPADAQAESAMEHALMGQWQALYDEEQGAVPTAEALDPTFEIRGWNSSLTGRPIPADEMREWVQSTVSAIAEHAPASILEVGCGTGLLLFPLLARCDRYAASDFSRRAIEHVRRHLPEPHRHTVQLALSPAHELDWLSPAARFETAVLNSVVQYFPGVDYLLQVLARVTERVSAGGRIFIGDVRNLDLAEPFHLALERARSDEELSNEAWRERVARSMARDKELLLSPGFFRQLPGRLPRVRSVEVRVKRGHARNELTMFRYDVTLHLDVEPALVPSRPLKWDGSLASLELALHDSEGALHLHGLVDTRVGEALAAHRALESAWSLRTARASSDSTGAGGDEQSVDVEALHTLAGRTGRKLGLRLGAGSRSVEALFGAPGADSLGPLNWVGEDASTASATASDPLRALRRARLADQLRAVFAARLPDVMIPSTLVFVDALPRTPNGKVDRRRLPAPPQERPDGLGGYVAPRTPLHESLCAIFGDALGFDQIGVHDNFFALGGHSLLAVQVIARIEQALGVVVPLASLFEAPTVDGLASRLAQHLHAEPALSSQPTPEAAPERLPLTPMDVTFHYGRVFFGAGAHAWYQVMELELGRVDRTRLEAAILHAMNRHPIARARISAARALGRKAHWVIGPALSSAPLVAHDVADEHSLDAMREASFATPFDFAEGSPFRLVLLRGPDRDVLLLRYNHAVVDGSGLSCFVRTVMSHYLGRPDPDPRILPLTTAELVAYHSRGAPLPSLLANTELAHLVNLLPDGVLAALGLTRARWLPTGPGRLAHIGPAPIHGDGGDATLAGCERIEVAFSASESQRVDEAARRLRSTPDRLFVVGLMHGAADWNRIHAAKPGRIEAYWAVNLRPARYFHSIVANQFAWSRVRAPAPRTSGQPGLSAEFEAWARHMLDPASDTLLQGAVDWIRMVEAFHALRIPDALRSLAMRALRHSGPSIAVSNTLPFGELELTPLGRAFGIERVGLHSRFFFTDRPVIVIGKRQGELHLRMVYPRAQFDAAGATRFVEHCKVATLAVGEQQLLSPACVPRCQV